MILQPMQLNEKDRESDGEFIMYDEDLAYNSREVPLPAISDGQ